MNISKFNKIVSSLLILAVMISSLGLMQISSSADGEQGYEISSNVEAIMKNYKSGFSKIEGEVNANIEQYRKSDATVKVVDKSGNPVNNATVKVNQVSHDFDFGCNALMLGQYDSDEKNAKYEQLLTETFNLVTTTMCFDIYSNGDNDYDFDYGEFRRPAPKLIRDFAKANGLKLKGQPLMADTWNPTWAKSADKETLKNYYINWFNGVYEEFGDDFDILDVVNESTSLWKDRGTGFVFCDRNNDANTLENVKWAFTEAKKAFEKAHNIKLEINDAGFSYFDAYLNNRLTPLVNEDLIDSIGFQNHYFSGTQMLNHASGANSLPDLQNKLNQVNALGKPIYITEITMPTNFTDTGKAFTLDESYAIQAEVVKHLYKLWFSIPNMNGIIYWNLADGEQWGSEGDALGCLVDSNLNPKPAYYVIQNYINNEWRTEENIVTGEDGTASFRGFHGNYEVTVTTGNGNACGTFDVLKDGANNITLVVDDSLDINNAKFVDGNADYILTADNAVVEIKQYDELSNLLSTENVTSGNSFKTNANTAYIVADTNSFTLDKVSTWTTPKAKASNNSAYLTLEQVNDPFFWQAGHYSSSTGKYEKYDNRICLRKLVPVSSAKTYKLSTNNVVENNTVQFIIREFNSSGTFLNTSAVVASGNEYTPSANTEYIAISINIKGDVGADVLSLKKAISNNTLNPTAVVLNDSTNPTNPTNPTVPTEPENPSGIPEVSTDYNLIHNSGSWEKGQYISGSTGINTSDPNSPYRIALNKKVNVTPGVRYNFDVGSSDLDTLRIIIRGYNSSGNLTTFKFSNGKAFPDSGSEDAVIPDDVVTLGVSIFDTRMKNGPKSETLLQKINDGSLSPSITNPLEIHSEMLYGASIRLKETGNGIRFYTNIDKDKINLLRENGAVVEMGTLIAPKDIIGSKDFTHKIGEENKEYIDVKYTADIYYTEKDFSGVVGSITEIREPNNVTRDFVGRGYIRVTKDGETYTTYANYYNSDTANNTRSLQFVANSVKNDSQYYEQLSESNKALIDKWAN